MKVPKFLGNKKPLNQGDVVIIFYGRGCRSGIIVSTDKRKSKIRFTDGMEMFVENQKLHIIENIRLKNRILRDYNNIQS